MSQTKEIIFRPKSGENIRSEFERFLIVAREEEWDQLKVLLGFAWGNYAYEGNWVEEVMSPDELAVRVSDLEKNEDGLISGDDLFIEVMKTGVQYRFSHENQIHLEGQSGDPSFENEVERYRSLGWEVFERTKE